DPYFKDNYPQAYVKDGTIWVRFQLEKPAEVYMLVNAGNGYWESDVNAVLEGRAGLGDDIIWVDDWPYFNVTDVEQLYEFDTEVSFWDRHPARIEFVIVDKEANYTSEAVTTIKIDPKSYEEED